MTEPTWYKREPDAIVPVEVAGHRVVTYSYGTSEHVLLLLNGGPGISCDYLREPMIRMVDAGYRVVAFDQLGTGKSDRPDDVSLWTIRRYAEEVEIVRRALGLGRINLLGNSWGGMLAVEYALDHQDALNTLILDNSFADVQFQVSESRRLRAALGAETVAMMQSHEAEGTFDHPEYQAALTLLEYRHSCRLQQWPEPLLRSFGDWNRQVKLTLLGPRTFVFDGNLQYWSRLQDLHRLKMPALVNAGFHDEITPASAMRTARALPNAECHVYRNASHMPYYECPDEYFAVLTAFLDRHRR
ncbi:MAG: proline iminopeptidase-family hydrolase [Dongiaceae bacterium]